MLATREHDRPPPDPRPRRWKIDDIVGAIGLALCGVCWVIAVIVVAIR